MKKINIAILVFIFIINSFASFAVVEANDNKNLFSIDFNDSTIKPDGFSACGFKDGINSFGVEGGIGGKEKKDNALFIEVSEYKEDLVGNYYTSKPFFIKNIAGNITENFTVECSIYSGFDKADSYFGMNVNGIYTKIFELKNNGYISLGGTECGLWQKGRWYHFAMEFDFNSLIANFYINGKQVLSNEPLRGVSDEVSYFGGMKFCCDCEVYGKKNFPVRNLSAFDNVYLYKGEYNKAGEVSAGRLIVENDYFIIDSSMTVSGFLSECDNNTAKIYTDATLKTEAKTIKDGCVAVMFSKDGKIIKYLTAADNYLKTSYDIDGNIIFVADGTTVGKAFKRIRVNDGVTVAFLDEKGNKLSDNDKISSGFVLVLQNKSGYVRKYIVNGKLEKTQLVSSVYTVTDDEILGVPKNTNSVFVINSLSADNPSLKIRLKQNDRFVLNEIVTDDMELFVSNLTETKTYKIKTGISHNFFENFENRNGRFLQSDEWQVVGNYSSGVYSEIIAEDGNNVLRMNAVKGVNHYIRTGYFDYADGIEISFDFKIESEKQTEFAMMMYDYAEITNYINLVNVYNKDSRIRFCGKMILEQKNLSDGWHNAKVKVCQDDKVRVFLDNIKIGEIESYALFSGKQEFDSSNCGVVFKPIGDGSFLIDNVIISDDVQVETADVASELLISTPKLYLTGEDDNLYFSDSVEEGAMIVSTGIWNNTTETEKVNVFVALMSGNKIEKIYSSSEVLLTAGENKSVDVPIKVENINNITSVRTFVWKSGTELIPLKEHTIIKKSGIRTPTKTAIVNAFSENSYGVHPRLMAKENDFERVLKDSLYDENISSWKACLIKNANLICENLTNDAENSKSPYYIAYTTEFNSNGQILEISRRVKNFIIDLGMAYQLTKDSKYSDAVWKIIQYVGIQGTQMSPWGFPSWNDKSSALDVAEMTGGVAIGYDWCFDSFSDAQKAYIQESLYTYGLAKFKNIRELYNSNTVYNSCMAMAALSLADVEAYKEDAINIICSSIKNVQYSLSTWNFDGAWEEGSMYAVYTSEYLAKLLSSLHSTLGSDFGISNVSGVQSILDYLLYIDGPTATNNYNDSSAKAHINDSSMMYFASLYNKPEYMAELLTRRKTNSYCMGALEMLWYTPESALGELNLNGSKYFEGNEVVVLSSADFRDTNRGWLSLQGGNSQNSHGHYDTGSFVYDSDNIRWIYDLGQENYGILHSSGLGRESFYRARPEGHNIYVINPDADKIGQNPQAYSPITAFYDGDTSKIAVLDMTQCYDDASCAIRGYRLSDNGKVVTVKDEISLKESENTIYWFLHLGHNIVAEKVDHSTVVLEKENVRKIIKVDCNEKFDLSIVKAEPLTEIDEDFVCEGYPNPESQTTNANVYKVMVKIVNASGNIDIGSVIAPYEYDCQIELLEKIAEWK